MTQPEFFRLCQIKAGVALECRGMRHSRGSVYALAKRTYGLKGDKANILGQLTGMIDNELGKEAKDARRR